MGEPVTEEMLADALRRYELAVTDEYALTGYEPQPRIAAVLANLESKRDALVALFKAADAAGYARAERDVVAALEQRRRQLAALANDLRSVSPEMAASSAFRAECTNDDAALLRAGAHRGAAKEGT